jgi:DNA-binding SARP family transcriptional activator/tetratricopeptide (TPR) repeat protein
VEFRVLGPLEVLGDGGEPVRLPGGRARIALALLCVKRGLVVPTDWLIHATWNGSPPATAIAQTQAHISALRRALGPARDLIGTTEQGYLLRVDEPATDLGRLRLLARQARTAQPAEAVKLLAEAVALWRGIPFGGADCAELETAADLIEQEYVTVLEEHARLVFAHGTPADSTAVITRLQEWCTSHAMHEGLHAALIEALARTGRQADAIAAYHDLRERLAEELGVDPGPPLRSLYQRIVSGQSVSGQSVSGQSVSGQSVSGQSVSGQNVTGQSVTGPIRPAQLPASVADFTGRKSSAKQLADALAPGATVAISAVTGTGGMGKTALAVHVAHLVSAEFPDGQLYVNLAGASAEPAAPGDVLARLLRNLDVPSGSVPADAEERALTYRSVLAGKRLLLVLDDARDAAQVRPLLPGSAGCAVLVTSRARLGDLAAVVRFDLAELEPAEAVELFGRIIGRARVAAEPRAAESILASCAGLPLAIRIAASNLAVRPGWSLAAYADQLAAEQHRLDLLQCGDQAVRASFRLSYDGLDAEQARMFRLLGLTPPGVLPVAALAALADSGLTATERCLEALTEVCLLEAPAPGQYRLHDLLRLFASELASTELASTELAGTGVASTELASTELASTKLAGTGVAGTGLAEDERSSALRGFIGWYAAGLRSAVGVLAASGRMPPGADLAVQPEWDVPEFGSHRTALDWVQRGEATIGWAIRTAAAQGWHAAATRVASLFTLYGLRAGVPEALVATQRIAVDSAVLIGDDLTQAWLLTGLGVYLRRGTDHPAAMACFEQALVLRQRCGDRYGEAASHCNLGNAHGNAGRFGAALENFRQAAAIGEELGDDHLLGTVFSNIGRLYQKLGDSDRSLDAFSHGVDVLRRSGDRYSEAVTRIGLGATLHRTGRAEQALAEYRGAESTLRELGLAERDLIEALCGAGETLDALDRPAEADRTWAEALAAAEQWLPQDLRDRLAARAPRRPAHHARNAARFR